MSTSELVTAAVLNSGEAEGRLLRSVVEVARAIFGAAASSVLLLDDVDGTLVFEAVSGAGEEHLIGRRISATQGIAGWVVASGEPLIIEDLTGNPTFSVEIARSTGYVPQALMAAPLTADHRGIGVLEILDSRPDARRGLPDVELLGLFADQASHSLELVRRSRAAGRTLVGTGDYNVLVEILAALDGLDGPRRGVGHRMLSAVRDFLVEAPRAPRPVV